MKTVKGLLCVAAAALALASCDKTPISDAQVSFTSEINTFCIEDGPNFDIPVTVTGENIVYPVTLKITNLTGNGALYPELEYSERNVAYRFLDRELVINSPEDKPVVTVRQILDVDTLYVGVKLEVISNCKAVGEIKAEAFAMPEVNYYFGDYSANYTSFFTDQQGNPEKGTETWSLVFDNDFYGVPGIYGYMGMTAEIGGMPLPCATGRMDWGEQLGEIFTVALTLDGETPAGAANLALDPSNPDAKTVCVLLPILFQGQEVGYYGANVFLGALSETQLAVSYPPYADVATYGPAYLAGVWMAYETGDLIGMQDAFVLDNGVFTKNSGSKAVFGMYDTVELTDVKTGEIKSVACTPYTGKLDMNKMPKIDLRMVE